MIIRRQLYANNKFEKAHDSGMILKPVYKKLIQPTSASDGTAIMRDIEDLLRPSQQQEREEMQQSQALSQERTERNLWRNDEVMEMLYTMQQVKALEKLNDKSVKSENVFKDVELIMHRNGFIKKSHVQIWTKWKFLKSTYMTSRRNRIIPRMIPPQIFDTIHKMITGLNQSVNDSCSSVDGDASSVNGMVISGVEGGVSDVGVTNEDDEDSFGMAHPIFGFRLGTVKPEPEDNGYEAVETNGSNASDKDPLEEELSSSKSNQQVKEEDSNSEPKTSKEPEPVQRLSEVPHRGRGRPPKNPPTATSTPISTPSPATKSAQMPPLRVAPFAKVIHSANAIAPNRPPPPLTMPPTPRIRVANLSDLKNGDPVKFAQPKLTPKPSHQEQSPTVKPVRLAKEISMQTRSSSTPSPSYPKMKQIPMRKTPYSLRPDRAIPDLEASLSPPPPAIEKSSNKKLEELPITKHVIMQNNSNNLQNNVYRKRRLDWQDPVPGKQAKFSNDMNEERNRPRANNVGDGQNYGKALQNVIIDLSSSLRKMQTEMMRDFFNKQNELLEREHRFQMRQDHMIMKAFQEQTQEIMHSVKQLVGSIKTNKRGHQHEGVEHAKEAKKANRRTRMQQKHAQEVEDEMEEDDEENEVEGDEHDQEEEGDHEMEQDAEDVYTDGEEQQDQMEEHEENDQGEIENNSGEEQEDNEQQHEEEESQSADEQHENDLMAEEQNNNNDSVNEEQNPLGTLSSKNND